jgi:N-formylmaleamate deformylase
VRTGGAKPPVVLLHGLMGSGACWTSLARGLEGDFDVVMPDARGHGDSSDPHDGYRYDDLATDVLGLVDSLNLTRPMIVGHSMGGLTAAVVAQRSKGNLGGLVLVDPTFLSPERQQEVWESDVVDQHRQALGSSWRELFEDARARHPGRSSEIVGFQVDARLKTRIGALNILAPPNPDYRDLVRSIDVPTLLAIGDSPVVSLELAIELSKMNEHVRVAQIRNAGHGIPFEQPEALQRVLGSFLLGLI